MCLYRWNDGSWLFNNGCRHPRNSCWSFKYYNVLCYSPMFYHFMYARVSLNKRNNGYWVYYIGCWHHVNWCMGVGRYIIHIWGRMLLSRQYNWKSITEDVWLDLVLQFYGVLCAISWIGVKPGGIVGNKFPATTCLLCAVMLGIIYHWRE